MKHILSKGISDVIGWFCGLGFELGVFSDTPGEAVQLER